MRRRAARRAKAEAELFALLRGFRGELAGVQVLDAACGSGNFLYVSLRLLLDLEKQVISLATSLGDSLAMPAVSPEQLHGIEINPYACELAQTTIWIGYIQWLRDNGFETPKEPILKPLEAIRLMDAIVGYGADGKPVEPEWPAADVIIGNPPFLGDKKMRSELGDKYVQDLRGLYAGRVPGGADLVTYWFEEARAQIEAGKTKRAGLLATQGIRGGANRNVLERIK
jgi:type II restriction/modification system DNA methylase subunit YeeA